jgi:hypothetical protein
MCLWYAFLSSIEAQQSVLMNIVAGRIRDDLAKRVPVAEDSYDSDNGLDSGATKGMSEKHGVWRFERA